MDGSNDRLLVAEDTHRLDVEVVDLAEPRGRIGFLPRLGFLPRRVIEIGAGTECLALRGQHRGPDLDIAIELLQRVRDLVDQRDVEEIQRRPLDFDQPDVTMGLDADVLVLGHDDPRSIESSWRSPRPACGERSTRIVRCAAGEGDYPRAPSAWRVPL